MGLFSSFYDFLMWILSGAGLSVIVPFVTQFAKKQLGLDGNKALALSAVVSAIVTAIAYVLVKYGVYTYAEEYWPLVVMWFVVVFGGSQVWYKFMPKSGSEGE